MTTPEANPETALNHCERALAQAAFAILENAAPADIRQLLDQAAVHYRDLPTELSPELEARRRQALRQGKTLRQLAHSEPEQHSCWQTTGDRHGYIIHTGPEQYVVIHTAPGAGWQWGAGPSAGPQLTDWNPERYPTARDAANGAAQAGRLNPQQAADLPAPDSEPAGIAKETLK